MIERKRLMSDPGIRPSSFSRRTLLRATTVTAAAIGPLGLLTAPGIAAADMLDELTIDLSSEPANLNPATTYDADGWSIVHSIYDAPVQYSADGSLQNLVVESISQLDELSLVM